MLPHFANSGQAEADTNLGFFYGVRCYVPSRISDMHGDGAYWAQETQKQKFV